MLLATVVVPWDWQATPGEWPRSRRMLHRTELPTSGNAGRSQRIAELNSGRASNDEVKARTG